MLKSVSGSARPLFVPVGDNPARVFGLAAAARAERLAAKAGLESGVAVDARRPAILADLKYAWDPAWLKEIAARPASILTWRGKPVLAHIPEAYPAELVTNAMASGGEWTGGDLQVIDAECAALPNAELRKRERPFVLPLDPTDPLPVERAAYDGAYKGVSDLLTLFLWRRPAFHLTRWAANAGLSPNAVTAVGALLCIVATLLFWNGHYWSGLAAALAFMVLDTVDGKLARCTGTSSRWGNIFDHGVDLIHPPFWWWAWAEGLDEFGTPIEPVLLAMVLATIIGGYVALRLIEGLFMRRYGMHIHVWRPVDSRFRLVSSRRNPNMLILAAALVAGRPDVGLQLVAMWTVVSLMFHWVRFAQANARSDRGRPIKSWLG